MNNKDILFYFMIAAIVILSLYCYYFMQTESFKCMTSPLTYGVGLLQAPNGEDISCSCSFRGASEILMFDKFNLSTSIPLYSNSDTKLTYIPEEVIGNGIDFVFNTSTKGNQ